MRTALALLFALLCSVAVAHTDGIYNPTANSVGDTQGIDSNAATGGGGCSATFALDGSNIVNNGSSSTAVIALTTANGCGIIGVGSLANVAISSVTAPGLTFGGAARSTVNSGGNISEVWTAPYTTNFSGNITVTYSSATFNTANAFGVSGAKTSSSFDSGGPQTSTSAAPPITTTNANDFIYSITSGTGSPAVPGAGWSLLGGGNGFFYGAIYRIVSSTQSGLTPDYSGGSYAPSAGITDAIKKGP